MGRAKELPKLTARRTPEIEGLLQELWSLRPELEDKNKLTIFLGLDALVRELKSKVSFSPTHEPAASEEEPTLETEAEVIKAAAVSDDVDWD